MWWRWNQSSHIFEKSTNDGGAWSAAPVHADTISEGLLGDARISSIGSWTPTLGGATGQSAQTYGVREGRYIKIGKLVIAQFRVTLTAKGVIVGALVIRGLPFTSVSGTNVTGNMQISFWVNMASAWTVIGGLVGVNSTIATVYGVVTAASTASSSMTTTDITDTTDWIGQATYETT